MEQLVFVLALVGIFLALGAGLGVAVLARKWRSANNQQQLQVADLNNRLSEMRHHLEALLQHTNAQFQRLTQPLPTAVPGRAPEPPAAAAATAAATGSRQSVTERRHRVLTLARRGMDIKAIAQTLGMPHGEVALIIRMSNPQFGD